MYGQIGQNLTVHFDASQVQAVDEAGIGQCFVMRTDSGVDPLDPQRAEVALAVLPVTRCVLVGLVYSLRRNLEVGLAATVVTFGLLDE